MAIPITSIKKNEPTPEEIETGKLAQLQKQVAEQEQALNKILEITGELDAIGVIDAAQAMLLAKEKLAGITVGQLSREPITNLLNQGLGAVGVLSSIDAETTTKLISSVKKGLDEAELQNGNSEKIGVMTLMKSLNDPDVNRAIKFGLHFLKGMGKELNEQ